MSRALRSFLLLALVGLLVSTVALAEVVPDVDGDVNAAANDNGHASHVSRVLFLNSSSQSFPTLPAGSKAETVIAFQNNHEEASQVVFLVSGFLQPPEEYHTIIQNFSVVRQARVVKKSETVSMHYTFTPDARLEPGEYNMVLGLYVQDASTNQTYFTAAFNSTVMVSEPLGTDPRTVLTYVTLLAIFAGVAYVIGNRVGLVKLFASMHSSSKPEKSPSSSVAKHIETGTGNAGYDPAYINPEHQRYRDELLRRGSKTSSSRHTSASPKKRDAPESCI